MPPSQHFFFAAARAPAAAACAVFTGSLTPSAGAYLNRNGRQSSHCDSDNSVSNTDERSSSDGNTGEGRGGGGGVRRKRARSMGSKKEPVNPCEEYNSLKWRLSYASRRSDCNAEPSCVFVGRDIMGACTPRDPSLLQQGDMRGPGRPLPNVPLVLEGHPGAKERTDVLRRHNTVRIMGESITELETQLSTSEGDQDQATKRFLTMMDELDVEQKTQEHALAILKDEGLPAVKVFLKSQLAMFASEELRLQKAATEAFAKDFLVQVLRTSELPSKMGQVLESVFKGPDLSTGTRHLIYNAVALDHTFKNALWLTRGQVTWLLAQTNWMDNEAAKLCTYLVRLPQTDLSTIPLVAWAVAMPGMLDPAAAHGLASSLPYGSEQLEDAMIWVTTETLRSDWALALAKDAAKDMMLSRHEERVPLAASAETAGTESGNESEPESGNRSGAKGEEKRSDAESAGADYAVSALASIDDDESESRVEADVTVEGHISGYDDSVDGPSTERGFDELKK